jgi:hypothetical protein
MMLMRDLQGSGKDGLDELPVPPSIPSLHNRWSNKMAADSLHL